MHHTEQYYHNQITIMTTAWKEQYDAIERVRALHKVSELILVESESGKEYLSCSADSCGWGYPCPTIKALNGE